MADSVSVTSHHSYGSRVGNSLKNIFFGIILVIISIVLLRRNESNFVKEKKALREGASIVQEATIDQINSELEGKEIHVSGETASTAEALQDSTFGITTDDLRLKRTVEMYQWYQEENEECHDNLGGSEDCTTTYTYKRKWSDEAIDSSSFHSSDGHNNPSNREFNSIEQEKSPITLGAYTLTTVFTNQLTNYQKINLSEQNIIIPEKYRQVSNQNTNETTNETTTIEDNNNSYLYGDDESNNESSTEATDNIASSNEKFHINGDYIYIGTNPSEPEIGDLKITFSSVKPGTVSIIGKQMGNELTSYTTSNGRTISLLEQGNVTAEDMFLHAQEMNKMMARILRFIGLFLMYCGFAAMLNFIETLAKVIPFLSKIIGVGTGIIALGLTIVVGFTTIAIAWLVVRPIIGICCLIVAAGGIFLLVKSKKNKKEELPKESQPKNERPKETPEKNGEIIEA